MLLSEKVGNLDNILFCKFFLNIAKSLLCVELISREGGKKILRKLLKNTKDKLLTNSKPINFLIKTKMYHAPSPVHF